MKKTRGRVTKLRGKVTECVAVGAVKIRDLRGYVPGQSATGPTFLIPSTRLTHAFKLNIFLFDLILP